VFFNGGIWRHQLEALGDLRRCIAVDLLAHGASGCPSTGDLDVPMQARMLVELLDALGIDVVDLIGNDSGGAICQLVAAAIPERISSLVLTNCDTHDNWPPEAFSVVVDLARAGSLVDVLASLDEQTARDSLATGFEDPMFLSDEEVQGFFSPFTDDPEKARALQSMVATMDNAVTVAIEPNLARLEVPTLIVWGTSDDFFDVAWATWLANTIPGARDVVELQGAKLFFPMERADAFNRELRAFWTSVDDDARTE
jgi:pimeloyl-ACP methyl ester carboxylesterase